MWYYRSENATIEYNSAQCVGDVVSALSVGYSNRLERYCSRHRSLL